MKKSGIAALIFAMSLLMLSVVGCSDDTDDAPQAASYLYVQNGTSGTFVDNADGSHTLTLSGASPQTIYFTDKPERQDGQVDMQIFLDTMQHDASRYPAVAIDILNGKEDRGVLIVQLDSPIYDSDSATLQYTAYILEDANHSIASFNERRDASIPESFGPVALFIDGSEVGMTYHNNFVTFQNDNIQAGKYVLKEFYVTSGQDPDHHLKIGYRANLDVYSDEVRLGGFTFVLGRKGSTDTANWWKHRVSSSENINGYEPDKLNFAMKGDFTFTVSGKTYVISDFFMAQGHFLFTNPWWIGGKTCSNVKDEIMTCIAKDEDGNPVTIQFNDWLSNEFLLMIK